MKPVVEFLVDDIGEEYYIARKLLCPKCRGKLKVVMQEYIVDILNEEERKNIGASERTDRLHIECQNCGFEFVIDFHLSSKYREKLKEIMKKFDKHVGK